MIIGLIVGGILTGRDLIDAAAQRAQITQIERYNTAVHTFQGKYGYLPGDIPDPAASNFGFVSRGQFEGEGDGNGIIEGNCTNTASPFAPGFSEGDGELAIMWVDLSTAGLIDAGIAANGGNYPKINTTGGVGPATTPNINAWLPTAKIGSGNNVYVYSLNGINYFSVSMVTWIGCTVESQTNPNLIVQQAYNIDKKVDDGLPQSGSVTACYVNHQVVHYQAIWAAGGINQGASGGINCVPTTTATAYASTNCFDNNGTAGTQTYSLAQNAALPNCALSFKFQ